MLCIEEGCPPGTMVDNKLPCCWRKPLGWKGKQKRNLELRSSDPGGKCRTLHGPRQLCWFINKFCQTLHLLHYVCLYIHPVFIKYVLLRRISSKCLENSSQQSKILLWKFSLCRGDRP
jgi:hypothetical protein